MMISTQHPSSGVRGYAPKRGKVTSASRTQVVIVAGCRWEDIRGTDHRLASALAQEHDVIWVDPIVPVVGPAKVERPDGVGTYFLDVVAEDITRLRVMGPPGPSRILLRSLCNKLLFRTLARVLRAQQASPTAIVSMSPSAKIPRSLPGRRILHVTDDWIAGATMMGLSQDFIRQTLAANLRNAHAVTAVTPQLAKQLMTMIPGLDVRTLPNGCEPQQAPSGSSAAGRKPIAALLGQLNERLDFDILDALVAAGIHIRVIGPRRDRDPSTAAQIDRLLNSATVDWRGEVAATQVPGLLSDVSLGITPYLINSFNEASFPLKTLEYLANGLPVVSTNSSATRWLDTDLIKVAGTSAEFVHHAQQLLHDGLSAQSEEMNRDFAREHSWQARATTLSELFAAPDPAKDPTNRLGAR